MMRDLNKNEREKCVYIYSKHKRERERLAEVSGPLGDVTRPTAIYISLFVRAGKKREEGKKRLGYFMCVSLECLYRPKRREIADARPITERTRRNIYFCAFLSLR